MENGKPSLPAPPALSGAAKWLLIVGLLLIANSAYLAAFGDPTLFYVANALLHPALGIVAAILLVVFLSAHRELLSARAAMACDCYWPWEQLWECICSLWA